MNYAAIAENQNPWWREPQTQPARSYLIRRDLQLKVLEHVEKLEERRALMVTGPRQVGKTVLLLQVVEDLLSKGWPASNITYFDFSDDRMAGIDVSPRDIADLHPPGVLLDRPRFFLFDEICRVRPKGRWADWLKQAVDSTSDRIVVTDSASSLLRSQSQESGFGRWDELRMEGLSFSEFLKLQQMGESVERVFDLLPNATERYFAASGFPEHARSDTPEEVRRRLRADIVDRAIMRDLRFLKDGESARAVFVYLVQNSGAIFKSAGRAAALDVDARSVRKWVRYLEETRLLISLPRRTSQAAARLRSRPKIYAADHGLVVSFAPIPRPLEDPHVRSAVFEAVVFRHLRDAALRLNGEISYFRRGDRLEVDFVTDLADGPVAIEVTCSPDPTRKLAKLHSAAEAARAKRILLVHGGAEHQQRGIICTIPLPRFILNTDAYLCGELPK